MYLDFENDRFQRAGVRLSNSNAIIWNSHIDSFPAINKLSPEISFYLKFSAREKTELNWSSTLCCD